MLKQTQNALESVRLLKETYVMLVFIIVLKDLFCHLKWNIKSELLTIHRTASFRKGSIENIICLKLQINFYLITEVGILPSNKTSLTVSNPNGNLHVLGWQVFLTLFKDQMTLDITTPFTLLHTVIHWWWQSKDIMTPRGELSGNCTCGLLNLCTPPTPMSF